MKNIIIPILLFTSCGSSNSGTQGTSTTDAPKSTVTAPNTPYTSYYVQDDASLKECNKDILGVLAYVESSKQFKACMNAGWTAVDVKGKDGSNGKDGTPTASNEWYDAISGIKWTLTNVTTNVTAWTNSMSNCTGSYRVPTVAEIQLALIHGMGVQTQAMTSAPSYIMGATNGGIHTVRVSDGVVALGSNSAEFCIQK